MYIGIFTDDPKYPEVTVLQPAQVTVNGIGEFPSKLSRLSLDHGTLGLDLIHGPTSGHIARIRPLFSTPFIGWVNLLSLKGWLSFTERSQALAADVQTASTTLSDHFA